MSRLKRIQLSIFILLLPFFSLAQYDSIVNSFKTEFETFKTKSFNQHDKFINKNDSIFIVFLNHSWKDVELMRYQKREIPKPTNQPVLTNDSLFQKLNYIAPKEIRSLKNENGHEYILETISPDSYDSRFVVNSFNFYGNKEDIYYAPNTKPILTNISENGIIQFYTSLSRSSNFWELSLNQLTASKERFSLNDWGYYQLVKSATEIIFEATNEQRLLCWYLLLKSGYNVKVGYNKNEIFLLIPSIHKLYNIQYLKNIQGTFYIPESSNSKLNNIKTYDATHPEGKYSFSFELDDFPKLGSNLLSRSLKYKGQNISIQLNKNIQDFLNSYPHCELKVYFKTALTENISKELDQILIPLLNGKSDREKVDELLNFCQHALLYKTDEEQFGKERYLFALESLYYPFSDCEDRTVLLAMLIDQYIGLKSVALDFPGHVLLAVNFNEEEKGTYITFSNKKYLVCDPTYINAKSGMMPEDLKGINPQVIDFN